MRVFKSSRSTIRSPGKRNAESLRRQAVQKVQAGGGARRKKHSYLLRRKACSFDIQELRDLTAYDELELDTLGDKNKKTTKISGYFSS
jgi:hypothetical protein